MLRIEVSRTGGSDGAVSVTLATADVTAAAGQDYGPVSTVVSFAAGDAAPKAVEIAILDDAAEEPTESFTVALSTPAGGATLAAQASATVTVLDDDAPLPEAGVLNDTGVTECATAGAAGLACSSAAAGTDQFPRQDGDVGRDASSPGGADGRAGFALVKLAADGTPLADQAAAYDQTPWACVRDEVTKLTWEVRTADGGLRDRGWAYSWYDDTGLAGGERAGDPGRGTCGGAVRCDTAAYREAVNALALCGFSDWRLPSRTEAHGLVDYGAGAPPLAETGYFPDAQLGAYWTGDLATTFGAWTVEFILGELRGQRTSTAQRVRLVRGGSQE